MTTIVYSRGGVVFWVGDRRNADTASRVIFETKGSAVVTQEKLK